MSNTMSYEKLEIWKESIRLSIFIYKNIRKSTWTDIALIQQVRRSMTSVALNIAEGMSRKTQKEKVHFLTIAFASCIETRASLQIINELNDQNFETNNLINDLSTLSRKIAALRKVVH
jgi:four helix bundle protein